ncbi:TIGR00730 family Rossman fold protein [Rummeliibacillus suwonensis]|uniref:LOG family protein n=1 Tax=Rummeliibacillus suwonensis TaxID=1306154 RepID=UPI0031333492
MMQNVAVFCGSSIGKDHIYLESAEQLGRELAVHGKTLIYGGAQVGCMGAIANATLENGGQAIGVIPQKLKDVEIAHENLTKLYIVNSMHERKEKMEKLANGFIALPGGAGTLEELFEVFTWAQLGYHEKPCGLLNVYGFFEPLLSMLDYIISQEFMKSEYKELFIVDSDPERLLKRMDSYQPTVLAKWS